MSAKTQAFFFSLIAILVLLVSALNPLTVYADSVTGAPPPPPPSGPHTPHQAPPHPNLSNVPRGTQVTVTNFQGHKIPLGSENAANAINSSDDPIWCPTGQSPAPGSGGCTAPFNSFNKLLSYLKTNQASATYQQAGTIYVEMGNYGGGEASINFNSFGLTSLSNYDLTIQGGWNTSNNTIDTSVGTAFNIPLSIGSSANPWAGSITLNDIQIQNVNNATALTVYSQSNVTLSDVKINNNSTGATINAGGETTINSSQFNHNKHAGAVINTGGVNISNSSFSNNGSNYSYNGDGNGLSITSNTNVSLVSVTANQNLAFGANVQANGSVFISSSFFSGNVGYSSSGCGGYKNSSSSGGYGLQVVTVGTIFIDSTTASNNPLYGATLSGSDVAVSNSVFDSNGTNSAKDSSGEGLQINASDAVSLYNVEADKNKAFGANIQAGSNVSVQNSFFSGNVGYSGSGCGGYGGYSEYGSSGGYGLQVVTVASIYVDSTTASNNPLYGASLSGSGVVVTNSVFDSNGTNSSKNSNGGLQINASSGVSLFNIEADNNQSFGANIQGGSDVSIGNSYFSGNVGYSSSGCGGYSNSGSSGGYGLEVVAPGTISLYQVTASKNSSLGASLNGANVVANNSTFDNNGSGNSKNANGQGLQVVSSGNTSLFNVEADNNQVVGANIQAGGTVYISNSFFSGNATYTYSPCKGGSATGNGLLVTATQDITLSQVTASGNGSTNAVLNGSSDVSVADSIFDNSTSGNGITINVLGQVTLQNVTADGNNRTGAYIKGNCTTNINVIDGDYSNNNVNGLGYVNAILNLSGSPTFTGNGAGNISHSFGMCDN
jgi:hypothetical protein